MVAWLFKSIWELIKQAGNLWGLLGTGGLMTSLFSWAASTVEPIAQHGWGAVILAGVVAASLFMIGLGVMLPLWDRAHQWVRRKALGEARSLPLAADPTPSVPAVPEAAARSAEPEQGVDADEEARHDLMLLVTDYVMPACRTQLNLQEMIIKHSYVNDALARLAIQSIIRSDELSEFGERFEYLSAKLCTSPMGYVPLGKLKDCVFVMDKNYGKLCAQADQLAEGAGLDCRTYHALAPLWEEWRHCHNRLVDAYRSIKRDRRFAPELYRPGIDGPWTKEIPPVNPV